MDAGASLGATAPCINLFLRDPLEVKNVQHLVGLTASPRGVWGRGGAGIGISFWWGRASGVRSLFTEGFQMSPLRMRMIEDMTLVGLSPGIDAVTRSTELALPSCMSADRRGGNPWLAAPRPSAASVGAAINAVTRCSPITPAKPLLSQMPHQADQGWLDARTTEVLPTYYFHVTITGCEHCCEPTSVTATPC